MPTTLPRRAHRNPILGSLSTLAVLGAAILGCPDALHLDADTTGSGASAGSGGGSAHCSSNPDCAYPTAVCDAVKGQCVECLVVSDCAAKHGTICSKGQCACPEATDTFCAAYGQQADRCVDVTATINDCGTCAHACVNGCAAGVCKDGWSQTSLVGAPEGRARHVAVWDDADKVMVVWGGVNAKQIATGGIYDLAKNTWTATSTEGAPEARSDAVAVWDDAHGQMIVWGGVDGGTHLASGGIFDPKANAWKPMNAAGAPSPRAHASAVWSGSAMIVWGGDDGMAQLGDGASYDPVADKWTAVPAGASARALHTAVWTGTSMIVWGGVGPDPANMGMVGALGDGFKFDGTTWSPISATNAPTPRYQHTAVWTGASMLIFGGSNLTQDGGQYAPDTWTKLGLAAAPEPRLDHTAVWMPTLKEMIVWGGQGAGNALLNTGYRLAEATLAWTPIPTALSPRARHSAVAAGSQMIIWGGDLGGGNFANNGGIFDTSAK